ncbi:MAG TPA: hypothetical protein VGR21_06490 [Cryptosporangiaceae bacterium]|nr:hypothetical protein [Cryptosporangiaceae bacterium]
MTGRDEGTWPPRVNGWDGPVPPPPAGDNEEFPPPWARRAEELTAPWVERIGALPLPPERVEDPSLPWAKRHAGIAPPRIPRQRGPSRPPTAVGYPSVPERPAGTARATDGRTRPATVIEGTSWRGTRRRPRSRTWWVALAVALAVPLLIVLAVLAFGRGGDGQDPEAARRATLSVVQDLAVRS